MNKMKRVQWIHKTHLFRADEFVCSECGASYKKPYRICPNCHSTMGKSKYEASWVDEAEGLSAILDDDW